MGRWLLLAPLIAIGACGPAPATRSPTAGQPALAAEVAVDGLTDPVDVADPGDGSGRLFVVEQGGTIRIIKAGKVLPFPFLDLSSLVSTGGEQGLLGLAFHPNFKANGKLYVRDAKELVCVPVGE